MLALAHGRSYVCYSKPGTGDKRGEDFDATGHLSQTVFEQVGIPLEADVYLCGPTRFMEDMKDALASWGVARERIHVEIFNGGESMTPGVTGAAARVPHLPKDDGNTGAMVSFARSGIAAHWNPSAYQSILELAEACDVPVRWSCRTGVCHNCESGLVSGRWPTDLSPSRSQPKATFSFAAHNRFATSSSICEAVSILAGSSRPPQASGGHSGEGLVSH